ncbi:hypothetical protein M3J09_005765 [Ascochyta lentis]
MHGCRSREAFRPQMPQVVLSQLKGQTDTQRRCRCFMLLFCLFLRCSGIGHGSKKALDQTYPDVEINRSGTP